MRGRLNERTFSEVELGPRITNYNGVGSSAGVTGNNTPTGASVGTAATETAAQPIAEITSLIINGQVGDAAITLGVDELHVYKLAVS